MCRVLSPTDLFQIDSKDCQHLVRVRCQLLKLFRVKNNEILFTVVTRLYYWNMLWTRIWNCWNVYEHRSLFAYGLASDSRLMQQRDCRHFVRVLRQLAAGWIQDFTWVICTNLTRGVVFPQENLKISALRMQFSCILRAPQAIQTRKQYLLRKA